MERNPALRDALRRHILTDELLHTPAMLLDFIEEQRTVNAEQRRFNEEQRTVNRDMTSRVTNLENRLTGIEGIFGTTRGYYARSVAAEAAAGIADDLGMEFIRILSADNLRRMIQGHSMEIETRRSFRNADLAIEATAYDGQTHFIAIEVSYAADRRDSDRAVRYAGILNWVTGGDAIAGVASVRNTRHVQELVESGGLHWHPLEDRTPEVE